MIRHSIKALSTTVPVELSIEDSIRSSLSKETRVSILKVEADGDEDSNLYNITIKFKIKENNRIETLPVVLRRLR